LAIVAEHERSMVDAQPAILGSSSEIRVKAATRSKAFNPSLHEPEPVPNRRAKGLQ